MKMPGGQARRLFLGFTCSIGFMVGLALLMAHNSHTDSSAYARSSVDDHPFTVSIPACVPEETIGFYKKLGFYAAPGLSRSLDVVCLERQGTPYKLEICHARSPEAGPLAPTVSGMSFPVDDLSGTVIKLKSKGLCFAQSCEAKDGVIYASLKDPNGISIKLFESPQSKF